MSIRGGSVYKVCNFSRRRYVKSFPTVGYWLSLVPVLPALREALGEFCCRVLTEFFGRYSTADRADARDRVDPATLLRFIQVAQEEDPLGRLRTGGLGGTNELPPRCQLRRLGRGHAAGDHHRRGACRRG